MIVNVESSTTIHFDVSVAEEYGDTAEGVLRLRDGDWWMAWRLIREDKITSTETWIARGKVHWTEALKRALNKLETQINLEMLV